MQASAPPDLLTLRFWAARVEFAAPDECWLWTGARVPRGYGTFKRGKGPTQYAHRFAVETFQGIAIPKGLVVHHHCNEPRCVNHRHLEVVTQSENLRWRHQVKDEDGVWRCTVHGTPTRNRRGWRSCNQCHAEAMRKRRSLNRES